MDGAYGHPGGQSWEPDLAAGGGGAGGPGQDVLWSEGLSGHGGPGIPMKTVAPFGLTTSVAGGGGGGGRDNGGRGSDGGGHGGTNNTLSGGNATSFGSGGGGAGGAGEGEPGSSVGLGGNGHPGLVVIRYPLTSLPPPSITVEPHITGDPVDGATLQVSQGEWNKPFEVTGYQWERCEAEGHNCQTVTDAQAASYQLTPDDIGHRLRATVSATVHPELAVQASSELTEVIAPKQVVTGTPRIVGEARHGLPLTVELDEAHWDASGDLAFTIHWQRRSDDWEPVADGRMYEPDAADIGHELRVVVTGTPQFGEPVSVASAPIGPVAPKVVQPGVPTLRGTTQDGHVLDVDPDMSNWHGTQPFNFDVRWLRCDVQGAECVVAGAENFSMTYELTAADIGHTIRAEVVGTPAHGTAVAVTTQPSDVVAAKSVSAGIPTVAGRAVHGEELTADADDENWEGSGTVTFSYQWERCRDDECARILGATEATYVSTIEDIGTFLRVAVTGRPDYGTEVTARSEPVGPVEPKTLVAGDVVLVGISEDGQILKVEYDESAWDASGELTFTTVWLRCDGDGAGCRPIVQAESNEYELSLSDVGYRLKAAITATPEYGNPITVSTRLSDIVAAKTVTTRMPVIGGESRHGETLTVEWDEDGWQGSGEISFSVTWLRCDADGLECVPITAGGPAPELELRVTEIGYTLRADVTGTPQRGDAVTVTSEPSAVVQARPITGGDISIAGSVQVNATLNAHIDESQWTASSPLAFSVVWLRCQPDDCQQVGEEHAYLLTGDDLDATIRIVVTATDEWGNTLSMTSSPVGPVIRVAEPTIDVQVASGHVVVSGSHFLPDSTAEVWLHSDPVLLGTVTVSQANTFREAFAVPRGVSGEHTIVVTGRGLDGQPHTIASRITIAEPESSAPTPPETPPEPEPSPGGGTGLPSDPAENVPVKPADEAPTTGKALPVTGMTTSPWVAATLVALLLGAALRLRRT